MASEIECFLLAETEFVRRSLRRFTFSRQRDCPKRQQWGCDASVVIDERLQKPRPGQWETSPDAGAFADDPRWPTCCASCGQPFPEDAERQVNDDRLYENEGRGVVCTLRDAPPGAMWLAHWLESHGSVHWQARGGGPHLIVQTPGGEWDVDAGSKNGDGWRRSGEPPRVTASPSIGFYAEGGGWRYHGWLRDGKLVEC